jgi:hypothetical protein
MRQSAEIATARLAAAMAMRMRSVWTRTIAGKAARRVKNPAVAAAGALPEQSFQREGSFAAGISAAGVFEPLYIRMLTSASVPALVQRYGRNRPAAEMKITMRH